MRKTLFLLGFIVLFLSCNDGDIIEYEVDFDEIETINHCGNLVLYKIKEEPFESLSIELNATFNDFINDYNTDDSIKEYLLSNANNSFVYRTYDNTYSSDLANNLFCNDIPTNVSITSDNESVTGKVVVTTELSEDDGDGIPAAIEDENLDGDNDPSTNPTDTDGDGIPDYLDEDDDGDNVPTEMENPNYSSTEGLVNAQDSDLDGTPDYLDTDDDDDGVLTRDEENETEDQKPWNDFTGSTTNPDYLDPIVQNTVPATAYQEHEIIQDYTIKIEIVDFSLPPLTQTYMEFGTMEIDSDPCPCTRAETPEFN